MWVSPFRNLRVIGYLLLAAAYRSLSRLSSALSAKASTLRSCSLNLISSGVSSTRLSGSLSGRLRAYGLPCKRGDICGANIMKQAEPANDAYGVPSSAFPYIALYARH